MNKNKRKILIEFYATRILLYLVFVAIVTTCAIFANKILPFGIILVAYTCRLPLDIAAVVALLFCFAGFFMGTKGAEWLTFLTQNYPSYLPNIICTFLTTEILGWSTYFIARRLKNGNPENSIEE